MPYEVSTVECQATNKKAQFFTRHELASDKIVITEIFKQDTYKVPLLTNGTVIDIGANIGVFSIYAILMGAEKVYAYEPEERNYDLMLKNIKLNKMEGKIIPIKKGILDKAGNTRINHSGGGSTIAEVYSLRRKVFDDWVKGEFNEVELITLDEAIKIAGNDIDFLKIDCEGSEYHIINGCHSLDKVSRISLEFHTVDENLWGKMVAKLSKYGRVEIIGQQVGGGMIYVKRY